MRAEVVAAVAVARAAAALASRVAGAGQTVSLPVLLGGLQVSVKSLQNCSSTHSPCSRVCVGGRDEVRGFASVRAREGEGVPTSPGHDARARVCRCK